MKERRRRSPNRNRCEAQHSFIVKLFFSPSDMSASLFFCSRDKMYSIKFAGKWIFCASFGGGLSHTRAYTFTFHSFRKVPFFKHEKTVGFIAFSLICCKCFNFRTIFGFYIYRYSLFQHLTKFIISRRSLDWWIYNFILIFMWF